jgi:hypothetical protein
MITNSNIRGFGFDPILEMDEQNLENNDESFMNENTSLLKDMKEQSFDHEVSISGQFQFPQETVELDEESIDFLGKMRKNFLGIKIQNKMNQSVYLPNKRQVKFQVNNNHNQSGFGKGSNCNINSSIINNSSNNTQNLGVNNSHININSNFNMTYVNSISTNPISMGNTSFNNTLCPSNMNHYNQQLNLSHEYKELKKEFSETIQSNNNDLSHNSSRRKRGRNKVLFDGVKTELIDKAILRQFKVYIKSSNTLKEIFDEIKLEEKEFWNEFMNNSAPPFVFNINSIPQKFKSYNKNLMRYIFSHPSVRALYAQFVKDKDKDIAYSILNKKTNPLLQVYDKKKRLYYSLYAKNLHKFYGSSDEV